MFIILWSFEEVVKVWIFVFPTKQVSHHNWEARVICPQVFWKVEVCHFRWMGMKIKLLPYTLLILRHLYTRQFDTVFRPYTIFSKDFQVGLNIFNIQSSYPDSTYFFFFLSSNEEAEVTTTKDWYHYSQQTPDHELFERLKVKSPS